MSDWSLVYEEFRPEQEGLREALCTLGNGYMATRGAAQEAVADDIHYPGTYLAGGYNRLETHIAERKVEHEDLVNFPNWLLLGVCPEGGDWFNPMGVELLAYRQELDIRRALLCRTVRYRDRQGRKTTLASRRFVHMGRPHLAGIEFVITPENWSGSCQVMSALDARVVNDGVERYRQLNGSHLKPLETGRAGGNGIFLVVETTQSHIRMAQAARTEAYCGDEPVLAERRMSRERGLVADTLRLDLKEGVPLTVEKIVTVYSSRDRAISSCDLEARSALARAPRLTELLESHVSAWARLWHRADITIKADDAARIALELRLHVFHLLQTVSPHSADLDVGVPARGLHGEAYRGHIFWDELFIFPYFLYRFPELARSMLRYRYRRLGAAREAAREEGLAGALFPWQSASDGREESQEYHLNPRSGQWLADNSRLQRHVNAAIVYNLWQYYQVTADMDFMFRFGAEIVFEIARMWSSLATYNPKLDRFEILGVMGPDEFHDAYPNANATGIDNNAYTNFMAAWVLSRALKLLDLLPPDRRNELCERLGLGADEFERWERISRKMRIDFSDGGIISQFQGYEDLEEFDWEGYRAKYGDIQRLDRILEAEGDTPNRYKVSKQADVLMLFYLFSTEQLTEIFGRLGYVLDPASIPRNIEYYLQRTSHGSTLSRVIHSWVLARSARPGTWELFREALESDIADIQGGTTAEGIHLGAMAATVDLVQRCYSGAEIRDDHLRLNPCLPKGLEGLGLSIQYRRNWLDISLSAEKMSITAGRSNWDPVEIGHHEKMHRIAPGERLDLSL